MATENRNRPNLVIINPDEWRGDLLGHLGNPAASTPTLDRMAAEDSISFRSAFCQSPVCVPSRCSFMTGWYPHVRGHRTQHHMLRAGEPNLLSRLRAAGYFIWWGGKNDLVPAQNGFDDYCDVKHEPTRFPPAGPLQSVAAEWRSRWPNGAGPGGYYSFYAGRLRATDRFYDRDWYHVDGAIDFLHNAPSDKPFCLFLPLAYPHPPYGVEEPWFSSIDRNALPIRTRAEDLRGPVPSAMWRLIEQQGLQGWSEEQWTELRATYYGMCARVDHQIALIIRALRETGAYGDTAVFIFADHGDYAGDYGLVEKVQNTFHDALTRVPLIIKPPRSALTTAGVSDALVELVDVLATIEHLTDLPRDYDHFGRTLLPLMSGDATEHRSGVFAEGGRLRDEIQAMELPSDQTREGLYYPRMRLQREDAIAHTKAAMYRTSDFKYVHRLYETDELYDLRSDPSESDNRIGDPDLVEILAEMRDALLDKFMATADVVPTDYDDR
jgi:arylsulfatase A-like enzyme